MIKKDLGLLADSEGDNQAVIHQDNSSVRDNVRDILLPSVFADEVIFRRIGWPNEEGVKRKVGLISKMDDSTLVYTLQNGVISNFPEDKIKDNPLLITKNFSGDYHFGHSAAESILRQNGMRPLTYDEMISPELEKYLAKKLSGNPKNYPGFRFEGSTGVGFCGEGDGIYFWGETCTSSHHDLNISSKAYCAVFDRNTSRISCAPHPKNIGGSLLGVWEK